LFYEQEAVGPGERLVVEKRRCSAEDVWDDHLDVTRAEMVGRQRPNGPIEEHRRRKRQPLPTRTEVWSSQILSNPILRYII